jgi:hypothetical protein
LLFVILPEKEPDYISIKEDCAGWAGGWILELEVK